MARPPAFQFYAQDWLADEDILDMSLDEEGAYVRLLAFQWSEGSIPSDPERLRRRLKGIHGNQFRRIWARIGHKFRPVSEANPDEIPAESEGNLINFRLNSQRIALQMFSESQREKAVNRWKSHIPSDAAASIRHMPDTGTRHPSGICSSSSSSSPDQKKKRSAAGTKRPPLPFTVSDLLRALEESSRGRIASTPFDSRLGPPITAVIRELEAQGLTLEDVRAAGREIASWPAKFTMSASWVASTGKLLDVIARVKGNGSAGHTDPVVAEHFAKSKAKELERIAKLEADPTVLKL